MKPITAAEFHAAAEAVAAAGEEPQGPIGIEPEEVFHFVATSRFRTPDGTGLLAFDNATLSYGIAVGAAAMKARFETGGP